VTIYRSIAKYVLENLECLKERTTTTCDLCSTETKEDLERIARTPCRYKESQRKAHLRDETVTMCQSNFPPRLRLCGIPVVALFLTIAPVGSGRPADVTTSSEPFTAATRVPAISQAACIVTPAQARFDHPLPRTARLLASDQPIKIVALGSSSTAGLGASSPSASYPSRLAFELNDRFPKSDITVLNRGASGEEAPDMVARIETSVAVENPDLIIWQLGTNWVLRDHPLDPKAMVLREGLARLNATGADIVLIDPQFAPKVLAKSETEGMVEQIAAIAEEEHIDLFPRFEVMRNWREVQSLPFDVFVSPDGLHMNDWSYSCIAKWLAAAIAEAATRPAGAAAGPLAAR
jgi:acyl-CoA thioesterase I